VAEQQDFRVHGWGAPCRQRRLLEDSADSAMGSSDAGARPGNYLTRNSLDIITV
jgi:hypothetical protein